MASFQSSLKLLEGASAFQIEKEFGGVGWYTGAGTQEGPRTRISALFRRRT